MQASFLHRPGFPDRGWRAQFDRVIHRQGLGVGILFQILLVILFVPELQEIQCFELQFEVRLLGLHLLLF